MEGVELRKELSNKGVAVLNANVLDYLLARPGLIPEEWKGKRTYFFGTIYCRPDGEPCVRYLYDLNDEWWTGFVWLNGIQFREVYIAVRGG